MNIKVIGIGLIIGITLLLVGVTGQFIKVGYLEEKGWEPSEDYPMGLMGMVWGILYCSFLWFGKHFHPMQHPILWLIGVIPLLFGTYVMYKMGVF